MPPRALKILGVICFVLLAIWMVGLYRQVHRGNKSPYLQAMDKATHVTLKQGGRAIFLQKEKQGWTVANATAGPFYAVDEDRWHALDSGLRDLRLEDVISENSSHAADFDVDANRGMQVSLGGADKALLVDGIFGKQAMDAVHVYFRYVDQPAIYLGRGLFVTDLGGTDLIGWRNHHLPTLAENQVERFSIKGRTFSTQVEKSSASWLVNGQLADADKVNTWIGAFAHLRADDFADRQSTSSPKTSDLVYAVIDAQGSAAHVVLHIGSLDPKGKRYPFALNADSEIAWMSEPRMQALLVKPADFQKTK